MVEVYIGWWIPYNLLQSGGYVSMVGYISAFFHRCAAIAPSYYYAQDATLMFMSKGGISADWCSRHGVRTKDKYLTQLQELWKNAYGSGKKKSGEMTLDDSGVMPEGFSPPV